jgi:transcriptional regulator with XRE-family HTH domain/tetratricopeptide (TPR) repeat protein
LITIQPTPQTGETRLADAVTPEAAFGTRLRQAREQEGVSLREMARRLTRSHSNLWDYERGHRLATVEVAAEYERELGLADGELQEPLEEARREVYGMDRDRRRPFRPPPAPRQENRPPAAADVRRSHTRPSGPFVGRDRQMASARSWLAEARSGEPRFILLGGDAGIGKSTLLAHVLAEARASGWLTLNGSCLQGARIAYLPLASALTPLRPGRKLSRLAPAARFELFFGEGTHPDEAVSDNAADRRHLDLFVAITQALLDAADQEPLVLAIEDLHWADDSTLGYLEHLAAVATQKSALTPVPLAVVLTGRRTGEGEPSWRFVQRLRREATYRELGLTGLDSLEINQLVKEVGHARPSPRLLRSVSEASQGNPLLLRSLLDRLLADGAIAIHDGLLGGQDPHLPAVALDLDAELGTRLERVAQDAQDLLTWAALLGDGQPVAALQTVTGYSDADFDRTMDLAAQARVLYEEEEIYRFDHPELREVLYAKMSARQRRRKHLAVAERLEAGFAIDRRDIAAAVAHHLFLAGTEASQAKLATTARLAAEQSFALAAWSDAASYYDMCLSADESGEADPYLLWHAGVAHFHNHDHREAQDRLLRAVDRARNAGDERLWGRAVLALTKSWVTGGSFLGADIDLKPLENFIANSHGDTADLRARAYSLISHANFAMFDFPSGFEQAQLALDTAAELVDDEVTAEAELALGVQYLAALQLDEAEKHLRNCERSAERLSDRWSTDWAASRLPLVSWCRGDLREADAQATRATKLASEHFDWAESSLATACRVAVAVAQGRFTHAERLGTLAHQQYLRSDYQWTVLVLAPALLTGRAFGGDGPKVQDSIEMIGHTGVDTRWFDLAGHALLGDLEPQLAAVTAQQLAVNPGSSYNLFDLGFASLHAEVCDVTGDPALAQAALGPLEAAYAAGFAMSVGWVASVPRLLGVVYRCLGRYDDAERWLKGALATCVEAGAAAELARVQLNLGQLLMGRGEERAAAVEFGQAAQAFRDLGLHALLQRCDRLQPAVAPSRTRS